LLNSSYSYKCFGQFYIENQNTHFYPNTFFSRNSYLLRDNVETCGACALHTG